MATKDKTYKYIFIVQWPCRVYLIILTKFRYMELCFISWDQHIKIWAHIIYALKLFLNAHMYVSIRTRDLNLNVSLSHHLHQYVIYVSRNYSNKPVDLLFDNGLNTFII